ncbi:hypothetical protein [Phyllobacterium sp. UNC302MFCol5.2]|uniref:hypothetical protein n=1 Tax=Phyllobacterium sp. UNC302MFCol5.2 TaxID=1449065 RepID=UPI000488FA61|nr:hypothetical protein [Phyllobacterium sp. UNC302MFCol5.2]
MLGFSDQISESIAHFVGYFHTSIEAARARLEYREFKITPDADPHFKDILAIDTHATPQLPPAFSDAHIDYTPMPWSPVGLPSMPWVDVNLDEIEIGMHRLPHTPTHPHGSGSDVAHGVVEEGPYFGSGASETSMVLKQTNHMQDNDVVIMGNKMPVNLDFTDDAGFAHLSSQAFAVSESFTSAAVPGNGAEVAQFFNDQLGFIHAAATGPLAATPGVTVITGPAIDGLFVNGEQVTSAPGISQSLPDFIKATDHDAAQPTIVSSQSILTDGSDLAGSVTVQAGANLMVNQVVLTSLDAISGHFAVAGNHYRIDAIVQTNAYSDSDTFENGFAGQQSLCQPSTNAMNIANFVHQADSTGGTPASSGDTTHLPQNWQITVINGDLLQMNWISQYSFISDNDMHVLNATGSYTTITTGANMSMNTATFAELCNTYDLVMIGGHYYDGNFIFQTNILFDNDTLTTGGAAGAYNGKLSTSDNLLWNAASIQSGDATNWVTGIPQHYQDALTGLASGNYKMPDGFGSDPNFHGIEGLRALYITGSVYDLNYVEQVNILGDSDYVAHYEDSLLAATSNTQWDISTGSNALVNIAAIVDHDTHGTGLSYVGGALYSDAILIQAEIIGSQPPSTGPGQGQPLANEVVAFLDHDADASAPADHSTSIHVPDTSHSVDVMQTVLS